MRSRRIRPVAWSTSYLLRSPLGISTSTSKLCTSSSTCRSAGRHAGPPLCCFRPRARRVGLGAVSRTMAPMRDARGSKRVGRDRRHSVPRARRWPVSQWLPMVLVVALLAAGVGAYRFEWGQRYLPAVTPPGGDAVGLDPAGALDPERVAAAVSEDLADPDLGRQVVGAVAPLAPGSPEWTTGD